MMIRSYLRDPALASHRPDPLNLMQAPLLDGWHAIASRSGDGYALMGVRADGQRVETGDLLVLDASAGWARTYSAFWRLGTPKEPTLRADAQARLQQVQDALIHRDAIRSGWRPSQAELDGAPVLASWSLKASSDKLLYAVGIGQGHPTLPNGITKSSPIVALHYDGRQGFARSWSRLYALGDRLPETLGGEPSRQAEFWYSETQASAVERALEIRYAAPPFEIAPSDDLYGSDQEGWVRTLEFYEDRHGEKAGHHLEVYLALRQGLSRQAAYEHVGGFLQGVQDSGYN